MEGYPLKDLELAEALQGEIFVGLFVVGVVADGTTLVGVLFTGVEGPLNATSVPTSLEMALAYYEPRLKGEEGDWRRTTALNLKPWLHKEIRVG